MKRGMVWKHCVRFGYEPHRSYREGVPTHVYERAEDDFYTRLVAHDRIEDVEYSPMILHCIVTCDPRMTLWYFESIVFRDALATIGSDKHQYRCPKNDECGKCAAWEATWP